MDFGIGYFPTADAVGRERWPSAPICSVLVGGLGPTVIDRVLSCGDARFPNWTPGILERAAELEKIERAIAEVTGEA